MIDTAIACHTGIDALMDMPLGRFMAIRDALHSYREKISAARED